jgi:hypothetical protein
MKKELARQLFSSIFLFIFFAKMVISIAPLIASHLDSRIVNAVIMQIEIETNAKTTDQAKDSIDKSEWLHGLSKFNFSSPHAIITLNTFTLYGNFHIQAFYPAVPTPPPNV